MLPVVASALRFKIKYPAKHFVYLAGVVFIPILVFRYLDFCLFRYITSACIKRNGFCSIIVADINVNRLH